MDLLRKSKASSSRRAALHRASLRAQAARDARQYRLGWRHRDAEYTLLVGHEREDGVVSIGERPAHDTILVLPPERIPVRAWDYSAPTPPMVSVRPIRFLAEELRYEAGEGIIRWWTWRPA